MADKIECVDFGGILCIPVEEHTEVTKDDKTLVVTNKNAVSDGNIMYMTKEVYEKLKEHTGV